MLSQRTPIRYQIARILLGAGLVASVSMALSTDVTSAQQVGPPVEMPMPVQPKTWPDARAMAPASAIAAFAELPAVDLRADALPPSVRAVGASPGYETGLCMGSPECPSITRTTEGWWIDVGGSSVLFNHDTED